MAIDAPQRTRILADLTVDQADELRMEIAALRFDTREDARHLTDPAQRLRESAIRDGRFTDFHDASLICARAVRMARRGMVE